MDHLPDDEILIMALQDSRRQSTSHSGPSERCARTLRESLISAVSVEIAEKSVVVLKLLSENLGRGDCCYCRNCKASRPQLTSVIQGKSYPHRQAQIQLRSRRTNCLCFLSPPFSSYRPCRSVESLVAAI